VQVGADLNWAEVYARALEANVTGVLGGAGASVGVAATLSAYLLLNATQACLTLVRFQYISNRLRGELS
jgi:hypothetical protein